MYSARFQVGMMILTLGDVPVFVIPVIELILPALSFLKQLQKKVPFQTAAIP